MRSFRVVLVAMGASVLAACGIITGSDGKRVVGFVQWTEATVAASSAAASLGYEEEPVLEAPDTVTAGQRFTVVVRTYAPNGCWTAAGEGVSTSGSVTEIVPYDNDGSEGKMCPQAVKRLPRTLPLTLTVPGDHLIRVSGRHAGTGGSATVEKRIVVR